MEHHHELIDAYNETKEEQEGIWHRVIPILQKRGWEYTSKTPYCYWLWTKKLKDGRTILCDIEVAIRFEIQESGESLPDSDW